MADYPDTLTGILGLLQLLDHPGEYSRVVGVSGVDEIQHVVPIPQVYESE